MSATMLDVSCDTAFAEAVLTGLSKSGQKELPSQYLYDELGSILFDAITVLPEYGLTRADARLLAFHAGTAVEFLPRELAVAELGSGTGSKTRPVLQAAARRRAVPYFPIDISSTALNQCAAVVESVHNVTIHPIHATYLEGLHQVTARRFPHESLLVLFLGSTIGNFENPAARRFLAEVRESLRPGDALLLGTDLVKPVSHMIAAYDDALGVTAAFNRNLLVRINRELDGRFDVHSFAHEARFNEDESRIEMHLCSRVAQTVRINAIGRSIHFGAGETIWTEGSYKFRRAEVAEMAADAGFVVRAQWVDWEWPFAETLMQVE